MKEYKKAILEIADNWSKSFFSKHHDSDIEKVASELFNKFKIQIEKDSEIKVMFMLLKVMIAEGMIIYGTRQIRNTKSDA